MDKDILLKKIAEELSAVAVFNDYNNQIANLNIEGICIGILGLPNTAKTSVINSLVDANLPITNLPSGKNYKVGYGENENISEVDSVSPSVQIPNNWLKEKKVTIIEKTLDIIPEEATIVSLCQLLSGIDICIYVINAQAALNRTDMLVLNFLNNAGVATILLPARIDLISEEDRGEVLSYIKSNIQQYNQVKLIDLDTAVFKSNEIIQSSVQELVDKANIKLPRENFQNFYLGFALSRLYENCQSKINECHNQIRKLEATAEEKKQHLNEKITSWLKVETELRKRTYSISDKLRALLDTRKSDVMRRLSHDVDVCGDVKLFWEKDFPYRLEELMKAEMNSAAQVINQEVIKTIQWLQDELLKQFHCRISLTTGIVGERSFSYIQDGSRVKIADSSKLKIVTRIGTAATVIAAGALFASSGIGGVVMAISMVSGLGTELFMRKQTNESKELIKSHIPEIIERSYIQLITEFNQKIQDVTNEIILHLQELKKDWLETSEKNIEQEKAIAIFNYSPSKWEAIMGQINQLSEIVLK